LESCLDEAGTAGGLLDCIDAVVAALDSLLASCLLRASIAETASTSFKRDVSGCFVMVAGMPDF
jgi:hypothetical protein